MLWVVENPDTLAADRNQNARFIVCNNCRCKIYSVRGAIAVYDACFKQADRRWSSLELVTVVCEGIPW